MTQPTGSKLRRGGGDYALFAADVWDAVGGLKISRNLQVGWQINPSIGIVAKDVARLADHITSFRVPLTRSVKQVVIPSIAVNFTVEGRPSWAPLAEDTIKRRGSSFPILTRTGALRRAATSFDIWAIGDTSATVRKLPQKAWYGAVHQSGYTREGGSFGAHIAEAKKELGRQARSMDVIRLAYELMDISTGGPRGQKGAEFNIPQRRFIMLQDTDEDAIQEVFVKWLEEEIIKAGRWGGGGITI